MSGYDVLYLKEVNMFDLPAYVILLHEVFITGYDNNTLLARLQSVLVAESETLTVPPSGESVLQQMLNSQRVTYAFSCVTGGNVSLTPAFTCLSGMSGRIGFSRGDRDGSSLLILTMDGVQVCAVGAEHTAVRH